MDGMSFLISFWIVVVLGLCIIVIVLSIQNADLKQQLSDMRIRELMYNRDSQFMQSVLADQVTHQNRDPRYTDAFGYVQTHLLQTPPDDCRTHEYSYRRFGRNRAIYVLPKILSPMTFQQQRTYKRIARALCDYIFSFGLLAVIYFFAAPPHKSAVLWGAIILTFVWTFIMSRLDKRSIDFIPDQRERKGMSSHRLEFNNRFDWIAFSYQIFSVTLGYAVGVWILHLFNDPLFLIIMCVVIIISAGIQCIYHSRNTYTIEGEMLHIKEYSLFRPLTEIHIPVSDISAIRIKAPYSPVRSRLVLTVAGIDRELRCTTNIIPLAQALATTSL